MCSQQFNSIVKSSGSKSIEGLFESLTFFKTMLYGSFVGKLVIVLFLFIMLALMRPEFKQNYVSKNVNLLYYATYVFYFPAIILTTFFVIRVMILMSMLNSVHKNKCAPLEAANYFKKTADKNFPTLMCYIGVLALLCAYAILDIWYFLRF